MASVERAQRGLDLVEAPSLDLVEAPSGDTWLALVRGRLPVQATGEWAVQAGCGAVVTFSGTARDHSPGRTGITALTYEAYEAYALARLRTIAYQARQEWPEVGRLAVLHRLGNVAVRESAVVVTVASPHRDDAFAAARFLIDTVKGTVPLWKKEHWPGGEAWADPCTASSPAEPPRAEPPRDPLAADGQQSGAMR